MHSRCDNPRHKRFNDWGGRGIKICYAWYDFETFKNWAYANGYKKGLLIERNDNDGNYEPTNCRWATMKEQGNNRRNNKRITFNGITMTQTQWANKLGIDPSTLSQRLKTWSIEKSITTPRQIQYTRCLK
jgi:hypothetical protein